MNICLVNRLYTSLIFSTFDEFDLLLTSSDAVNYLAYRLVLFKIIILRGTRSGCLRFITDIKVSLTSDVTE